MLTAEQKKSLMEELAKEERVETDMIHLYQSLMESGAIDCLPPGKQDEFKQGLEVLHGESEEHQRVIFNIIENFKKENY
jgi:hypothetical protein